MTNDQGSIRVLLLISQEYQTYALAVCGVLSQRFGITNVQIRSSTTPSDRLLSLAQADSGPQRPKNDEEESEPAILFATLGPNSTSSTAILETESAAPILTFPANPVAGGDNSSTSSSSSGAVSATALAIAKCAALACPQIRDKVRQVVFENRQARLVQDAQYRTSSPAYTTAIARCWDEQLQILGDAAALTDRVPDRIARGKVRDVYPVVANDNDDNLLALVTTDRQSGFDRQLALVPYKGAVLNLTSAYWFEQTRHIIPNHLVAVPHPYVSICRKCQPFPIEFVVRSYMTGSTSTSIWKNYQNGVRNYCGHALPEGMMKNQKLAQNLLTPTTKEANHDRPISLADIVAEKWMTQADLDVCAAAALQVFQYGQDVARQHGLILVDTKYEFGRDVVTGEIRLIDEVHTPDSSRYWLASTYEQNMLAGREPDNIDKEFLRLWFREHCDPYQDKVLPPAPRDLVLELSRRYITLYEMITWKDFDFGAIVSDNSSSKGGGGGGGEEAIAQALLNYSSKAGAGGDVQGE